MNYQTHFQQRWPHLNHAHVRSLAWLLDSPVLLNEHCQRWAEKLVELPSPNSATRTWLAELEHNPEPLIRYLDLHPRTRLGHYAENLLAFYLTWQQVLVARNVQVCVHTTIGEFDFLLKTPTGLAHWEFACKFYLLIAPHSSLSDYVGPSLNDNLNQKSKKIIDVQLALGQHPDAQKYLPSPLSAARALVKGWLFYDAENSTALSEIEPQHCRGLWCRLGDLKKLNGDCFSLLSRLQWLAPAKVGSAQVMSVNQLQAHLTQLFLTDSRPVLIAQLMSQESQDSDSQENFFVECERIFVVPDDWNEDSL